MQLVPALFTLTPISPYCQALSILYRFYFVLGSRLFNFTQMKILDYANDMIQLSAFTQLINKQLVCYISCFHAIVDMPMVLN